MIPRLSRRKGLGLVAALTATVLASGCSLTLDTDCEGLCPAGHLCQSGECVPVLPEVTAINGDGSARAVVDEQGLLEGVADRVDAPNRFHDRWLLSGEHLDLVTELALVPERGGGAFTYEPTQGGSLCLGADPTRCFARAADGESWELLLPLDLTEGAHTLRLAVASGDQVSFTVMVLRGEKGVDAESRLSCDGAACTLDRDLRVGAGVQITGQTQVEDLASTGGSVVLAALGLDHLGISSKIDGPPCPVGYTLQGEAGDVVLCTRQVADGQLDQVVGVGDFWIDRFEASVWRTADCTGALGASGDNYPAGFPNDGQWTEPAYACSVAGVSPSRYLTWFQAQQACVAAGKRLCTNAQWQAAAAGTWDPPAAPSGAQCNTADQQVRLTGSAGADPGGVGACISNWGAEDMVGNLAEWVADWLVVGPPPADALGDIYEVSPWPNGFSDDLTRNVVGSAASGNAIPIDGLPAALVRGGDYSHAQYAGVYALDARYAPSHSSAVVGVRCCTTR